MQLETGNLSLFCLSAKLVSYHTVTVLINFSILNIFMHLENTSIVSFSHIARKVLIRLDDKKGSFRLRFSNYAITITHFSFPVQFLMVQSPISVSGGQCVITSGVVTCNWHLLHQEVHPHHHQPATVLV